jgi:hypothetical protein
VRWRTSEVLHLSSHFQYTPLRETQTRMLDWLRTKKGHGVAGLGQNYARCQVQASENIRLHAVW